MHSPGAAPESSSQHGDAGKLLQPEATVAGAAAPAVPQSARRDWFAAAKLCSVSQMASLLQRHPGLLLARGAGLGHSALHWCAARGDEQAVLWLLEKCRSLEPSSGAGGEEGQASATVGGVNLRNEVGSTPLHAAASNGCAAVVSLLLRQPDINAALLDDDGRTAEQAASDRGHAAVSAAIRDHLKQQASSGLPISQQQQEGSSSVEAQATSRDGVDTVKCERAMQGSTEESAAVPEQNTKAASRDEVPPQHLATPTASVVGRQPVTPPAGARSIADINDSPEPPSSSEAAAGSVAGASERARRRAALLAESAAADALEEKRDAQRQGRDQGIVWLYVLLEQFPPKGVEVPDLIT